MSVAWPRTAPTKTEYTRYFPCPYCKGAGGHNEAVPGMWEAGPRYTCTGCNGSGDGRDYVRVRDQMRAKHEHDVQVVCDCRHDATWHYEGTERCAYDGRDESDPAVCECPRSRQTVLATFSAPPPPGPHA